MNQPIKRLARFAETTIANMCAAEGALCHESQEDENGWDYFVEFPADKFVGTPDTQERSKRAFIQVKSSRKKELRCTIKLSNALKSVQDCEPWFIVLMIANGAETRLYVRHIWGELIESILRKVRQASVEGLPLHRKRLTINFTNSHVNPNCLVSFMAETINQVGPKYSTIKSQTFRSAGYQNGAGSGSITLHAKDTTSIVSEFLGLGSGLTFDNFSFTPARFGISDKQPSINISNGVIKITPSEAGVCELRLRSSQGDLIVVPGKLYVLSMPWLPTNEQRFRIAAVGFELLCSVDGSSKFKATLDQHIRFDLDYIERYSQIVLWLAAGPINLQVWAKGRRLFYGSLNAIIGGERFDWDAVAGIIKTLKNIEPASSLSWLQLSLTDINAGARDLYILHQVYSATTIRLEFNPLLEQSLDEFSSVLYYAMASAGNIVAYALIERKIVDKGSPPDKQWYVNCGPSLVRESWILPDENEDCRRRVQEDYARYLDDMSNNASVIAVGDVAAFVRSPQ